MDNQKPDLMKDNNGYNYEMPINTDLNKNSNIINYNEDKKKEKKDDDNKGYTIGFIILVVVIVGLLGLYIWSIVTESDDDENESIVVEKTEVDYAANLSIEEVGILKKYNESKELLFKIKNGNDALVSINLTVTFYDENGNMTDKVEKSITAASNRKETYIGIETSNEYSSYKTKMTAEDVSSTYEDYTSKGIDKNSTVKKDKANIEIINNTGVELQSVSCCIIYYKDGAFVGFSIDNVTNIENGESGLAKITIPTDYETRTNISFDQYKIILYNAYVRK